MLSVGPERAIPGSPVFPHAARQALPISLYSRSLQKTEGGDDVPAATEKSPADGVIDVSRSFE